ncbi:MAG: hypothetical protein ACI80V_002212 [Rhodothermales bacterium]|jgi:hypothetical protein
MKHIVITSIFEPTEAVRRFAALKEYRLIVAGDLKSPNSWVCEGARFLSAEEQKRSGFSLAPLLPFNHYCRKLLGYLAAVQNGATGIVDTDDDNYPYEDWSFPSFSGDFLTLQDAGYLNIYRRFTDAPIWPRGFPLKEIRGSLAGALGEEVVRSAEVGIWQGLADEDPDVDAIYRLTSDVPCQFDKLEPVVLEEGSICPFNSQNTAFSKRAFPLLYLPSTVTFRFTDILRGLVAQPILWAAGLRLGFTGASVKQIRNPHDYMADFRSEVPMFLHGEQAFDISAELATPTLSVAENLHRVYHGLLEASIVTSEELPRLEAWLRDLESMS